MQTPLTYTQTGDNKLTLQTSNHKMGGAVYYRYRLEQRLKLHFDAHAAVRISPYQIISTEIPNQITIQKGIIIGRRVELIIHFKYIS